MLHFELSVTSEVFGAAPAGVADRWSDVAVCEPGAVRFGRFRLEPTSASTGSSAPTP
jgi:AraC family transcriptional activator FtrA